MMIVRAIEGKNILRISGSVDVLGIREGGTIVEDNRMFGGATQGEVVGDAFD